MPKECCAVDCNNLCEKGNGLTFYTFPTDPDRRSTWIAAVNRKEWYPTEHRTVKCSEHFIHGQPVCSKLHSLFKPPMKRKIEAQVVDFYRRTASTRESEDWNKLINLLNKRKRQRKGRCRNLLNPGKLKKKQEKQNEEQKRLEEERKRHEEDERERLLREEESRKAEQATVE